MGRWVLFDYTYGGVLTALGTDAGTVTFVNGHSENVAGAAAVGMRALLFHRPRHAGRRSPCRAGPLIGQPARTQPRGTRAGRREHV